MRMRRLRRYIGSSCSLPRSLLQHSSPVTECCCFRGSLGCRFALATACNHTLTIGNLQNVRHERNLLHVDQSPSTNSTGCLDMIECPDRTEHDCATVECNYFSCCVAFWGVLPWQRADTFVELVPVHSRCLRREPSCCPQRRLCV
jgi:hypothetical protein